MANDGVTGALTGAGPTLHRVALDTTVGAVARGSSRGGRATAAGHGGIGIGTVIRGRFELESLLGAGGMGTVYRAVDRLHREMQDRDPYVAIKILNADLERHPSALIALQRETRKAQVLAHENIINVHSFDRDGSVVYMTMELLEGKSLRTVVAEHAAVGVPAAEAIPMIRSMAKALAYAHANDIVHADFKPGNVFLTRKRQIKVLDFGLARVTPAAPQSSSDSLESPVLGGMTPAYASPAVQRGEDPTPADDVFALAMVALELLTGRHPFDYERADDTALAAVRTVPLPKVSRLQRKALLRAFGTEPGRRYENASEFLRDFDGPSALKKAAQAGVLTVAAAPVVALLVIGQNGGPAVAFEDLAPEVRQEFERAASEGETALQFGMAGINEALGYFSSAYALHPGNPRAVQGLETVTERLLGSLPSAEPSTRERVFGLLYCNDYLARSKRVASACGEWLGSAQCAAIAARCGPAASP